MDQDMAVCEVSIYLELDRFRPVKAYGEGDAYDTHRDACWRIGSFE